MSSGAPKFQIDVDKLPTVVAVDAGVLFRGLERHHRDRYAEASRAFWDAMLASEKREIMLPAPAVAEYMKRPTTPLPSTEQVYVVPFDRICAELLAEAVPADILKIEIDDFKAEYGDDAPGSYIKYDAMIAACAKRWGAQRLVSIDRRMKKIAARFKLDCQTPDFFYGPQRIIDVPHVGGPVLRAVQGGQKRKRPR